MDTKPTIRNFLVVILPALLTVFIIFFLVLPKIRHSRETVIPEDTYVKPVTNFEECVAAGNPVMESYPRQCRYGDTTFVENIGNELEKGDLIRLDYPRPNQVIESPLTITGEARGSWYFEADFPVMLVNWDGLIIAEGIAQAQGDWMTEEFVPFTATLEFEYPTYKNNGALILQKDNPSGLPENDDVLEIPIFFKEIREMKK